MRGNASLSSASLLVAVGLCAGVRRRTARADAARGRARHRAGRRARGARAAAHRRPAPARRRAPPACAWCRARTSIEMKMVFGCDGEQPACMAQAGKSLGADKLLYGTLKKARQERHQRGGRAQAARRQDRRRREVRQRDRRQARAGRRQRQRARPRKWFAAAGRGRGQADARPSPPSRRARRSPSTGSRSGRTPVTLRDLPPGAHTVALSLAGRVTADPHRRAARRAARHEVAVHARGGAAASPSSRRRRRPSRAALRRVDDSRSRCRRRPSGARRQDRRARRARRRAVVAGAVAIYTWRTYARPRGHGAHRAELAHRGHGHADRRPGQFFASPGCNAAVEPRTAARRSASTRTTARAGRPTPTPPPRCGWSPARWPPAGVVSYIIGDRQAAKAEREKTKSTTAKLLRSSRCASRRCSPPGRRGSGLVRILRYH